MKNIFFILFTLAFINLYSQEDIEEKLFELPDVIFKKIDTPEGYISAFEMKIKQPIDHNDVSKGHFYQRVYLSHKGYENPTAIITNGYGRPSNNITEVAKLINANQINVEHRYFLESSPDSLDYTYLNFEQVTADLHYINTLFKQIYKGKWVSTGISKGGTTTIMYKYFFPDDVDVSIPYVAPINLSDEDERIYSFLDKVGTEKCREDILNYQKHMLRNADKYKPYLKWFAKGAGLKFNYLTFDEAYEYAILEYPFSFWQYGQDCKKIPTSEATDDENMQYLLDIVGLAFYSDADMEAYGSHYYQSGTEMGYYGFETEDFEGLLKHLQYEPHPSAVFMPNNTNNTFDGELTQKVYDWAKTATNIIYINGALDTWSATAVPVSDKTNALFYFLKDKHHGNARIKNMNDEEKALIVDTLEKWLSIDIE